jgi:Bacterial SH3 domain
VTFAVQVPPFARIAFRKLLQSILPASLAVAGGTGSLMAQAVPYERTFPQSKTTVEKTLKSLPATTAGRLPVLDGFTIPGEHPLEHYHRGYYQCTIAVSAASPGKTLVKVTAKITAWYADPVAAKSGYQLLPSNGRLEGDLLDEIAEALGSQASVSPTKASNPQAKPAQAPDPSASSLVSAPVPRIPEETAGANLANQNQAPQNQPASVRAQTEAAEKHAQELATEARSLEEILNNQSHPNNLVAVKKSGTAVLANPAADAKVLFAATAGDEFEILDENPDWIHVRISGLSRGWVRRSSLEMPGATDTKSQSSAENAFHITSEQLGPFPGDWHPLREKTVEIISVQKQSENASNSGASQKLEFAKALFAAEYGKLTGAAEGIVLIFDSEDGGMVAATVPMLQQWKAGTLSDEAFWRQCFFDPPEVLSPAPTGK